MPNDPQTRKEKSFRAVMIGLAVGSGTFLLLRYVAKLDVDPALIVGTGLAVAVSVFLLKRIERR